MPARPRVRRDADRLVVHGPHPITNQRMRSNRHIYTRDGDDDVLPPKPKAIDKSALNRLWPSDARHVVQITLGIWTCQMKRRWDELMLQGEHGSDELKRPACGKGMAKC